MFSKKVVINGVSYTEKKLIGEGAFAYVYHMKVHSPMRLADAGGATDKTKQQYAVKKLLCQTPEQRNDALKEIEVLKTVDHEFVMPYVDSESNQTEVYIVMPLCDLGTLQQFVTRGVFPFQSGIVFNSTGSALDTAIKDGFPRVLLQTMTGLLALHRAGFRHADLKPDNILLQFLPSAEVKPLITDFGSATPIRQVVQSKADRLNLQEYAASYTTASYRAPELWEASDQTLSNDGKLVVDGKADVWSFGCIIYALLYASTPFESAAQGLSTLAIQSGTYKKPSLPCTASKSQTTTFLMYNQLIQECLEVQTEARVDAQGLYVKMKDFDSAASGSALVEVLTLLGQQTALPPHPPAAAAVVAAAPTLPAAAPKVVATPADIAPATCTPSATSDNFANFANFPAGGHVEQPKEVVLTAAALSDDDFGDFADFDSVTIAPAAPAPVAPAPVSMAAAKGVPAAVRTVPVPISTDSTFLSDVLLPGYEKAGGANGLLFCSRVFVRRTTGFLRKTVSRKPADLKMTAHGLCIHKAGSDKVYHRFLMHDDSRKHIIDAAPVTTSPNTLSFTGYSPYSLQADGDPSKDVKLEANIVSSLLITLPLIGEDGKGTETEDAKEVTFMNIPLLLNTVEFEFDTSASFDSFLTEFDALRDAVFS